MPKELTWDDAEDIGILLLAEHPNLIPLETRFTDLHRMSRTSDFNDDPNIKEQLEAIQMAWHEEFEAVWFSPQLPVLPRSPHARTAPLLPAALD